MCALFVSSPGAVVQRRMIMIGLFGDGWLPLAARPRVTGLCALRIPCSPWAHGAPQQSGHGACLLCAWLHERALRHQIYGYCLLGESCRCLG